MSSKEMTIEEAVKCIEGIKYGIDLFDKEIDALEVLLQHAKEVRSKEEIEEALESVTGINHEEDNYEAGVAHTLDWTLKKEQ
jgi:DNA-binding response OmpR family regulator